MPTQPDLIRHSPAELARIYRIAAETERRSPMPTPTHRGELCRIGGDLRIPGAWHWSAIRYDDSAPTEVAAGCEEDREQAHRYLRAALGQAGAPGAPILTVPALTFQPR